METEIEIGMSTVATKTISAASFCPGARLEFLSTTA